MEKLDKRNIENILALTPMQEGMLFHYLNEPESDLYFEQLSLDINGEIDLKCFEQAWNFVIETNEMLRVVFRWEMVENPIQIILKEYHLHPEFYDFPGKSIKETRTLVEEIKTRERVRNFDLQREVPFRVALCKIEKDRHEIIISYHHILYDGWSSGIILKEFFNAYTDFIDSREPGKPVKTKFNEFVKWTQDHNTEKQEKFWRDYLKGFDTQRDLSIKRRGKEKEPARTKNLQIPISKDMKRELECFVKKHKLTLASLLYSAWGILLQKYNNTDDVVFGTTVSGRSAKVQGIEEMVGLFINTLPLRIHSSAGEKIEDLLYKIENSLQQREAHVLTSLVNIKAFSELNSNEALFDSIVVIENYPLDNRLRQERGKLSVDSYSMVEMTHYDLTIGITIFEEIEISFIYNEGMFDNDGIKNMCSHFRKIILGIVTHPDTKISDIEIISEEEKDKILFNFNNTGADYPGDKTIHQLFEEQAERTGDRVAVVGMEHGAWWMEETGTLEKLHAPRSMLHAVTYGELNEKSDRLAYLLKEKGVKPDTIVGIMTEPSVPMVIGLFGILKSGGAYLPIDPGYPEERIKYMLADSAAKILLTSPDYIPVGAGGLAPLYLSETLHAPCSMLHASETNSSSLAYIIYTSGTTGRPKGVAVAHRNVVNTLLCRKENYKMKESDMALQLFSFSFDGFVTSFFTPIISGASVVLVSEENIKNPAKLAEIIVNQHVTHFICIPPLFRVIFEHLTAEEAVSLKVVTLAGDNLPAKLLEITVDKNPGIEIVNEYGVTESSVMSTLNRHQESDPIVNIGKPAWNTAIYILDQQNRLQPVGIPGELCISGRGVGRGYLNKPERTAEKFDQDFWDYQDKNEKKLLKETGKNSLTSLPLYPSTSLYRTGDLGRWLPNGNIEFMGRIDHQVKIRGFRIESGEIESCLLEYPLIKEAVVIDRDEGNEEKYLCAYFVSEKTIGPPALKEFLAQALPDYMIPSYFVQLDKIPLTSNGKVNKKALPSPDYFVGETYNAPRDEIEKKLAAIWAEVLRITHTSIGIDHNFLELGGHSLKATRLVSRIHRELNIMIPISQLFQFPTIRGLTRRINKARKEIYVSIKPTEEKEYYVLSAAQKRLYILQQMEKDSISYNMPRILVLEGEVDRDRLAKTFYRLIKKHENFRTSFDIVDGKPVQRIHSENDKALATHPIKEVTNHKLQITNIIKNFIRPFDLSQPPLLRVGLHKMEKKKHLLLVDMHHIISDGISAGILIKEFMAISEGEELPAIRTRYRDFSEWQNSESWEEVLKDQEAFWVRKFAGDIPALELPTDFSRPIVQQFEGRRLIFEVGKEETFALQKIALRQDATLYMVLLAILYIILAKISNQEDIVIGTPMAGRRHPDLENIIGMFVNTLALRNYPDGKKTFQSFLGIVKESTLEAFENQDYPFEELVENLSVNRDTGRNPLFDVMFVLQDLDIPVIRIPGLKLASLDIDPGIAKFDLTFTCEKEGENLLFSVEYSTRLFQSSTIERFAGYFKKVISDVTRDTGIRISEVELMSQKEKEEILYDFNDTTTDYPADKTIHQLFEEQVARTPDRLAVVGFPGHMTYRTHMTYKELNKKSNLLSHELTEKGVKPGGIVGIMADRSIEIIVGILGILKAGGAYLPIDPEYPEERIRYMLADSSAKFLMTDYKDNIPVGTGTAPRLAPLYLPFADHAVTNYRNSHPAASPENIAYIIYTSGTTGQPKGTLIQHRNVVRLMINEKFSFDFDYRDVWTLFHSQCFDFSVWEMYGALLYGGKLVVIPRITAQDTEQFLDLLIQDKVTVLNQTPSAFYRLVNAELNRPEKELNLKYVIFGGETLNPGKLKQWKERYPRTTLVNMYGITETTVHVTYKAIGEREIKSSISNIGQPIPTLTTYVMDKYLNLQPIGVAGELFVGGEGVGRGYLNRPSLTAEKFVENPYKPYERLYRSGDLARIFTDGEMEYLGRIDQQVKIRGFRIELGEIEIQLLKHKEVKETVVVAKEDRTGDKYLCAYIVPHPTVSPHSPKSTGQLKKYLSRSLPDYMIPSHFVWIERIPLNPNGKLDREKLPEPEVTPGERYEAPENEIEEKLVGIWAEVLNIDRSAIGVNDDFFELGGHSLTATVVMSRIHNKFNVRMTLSDLFTCPFIRELAQYIKEADRYQYLSIGPVEKKTHYALSSAQKRLYILQQANVYDMTYNMPQMRILEGKLDKERLAETFQRLIERHESFRTSFFMVEGTPAQKIHGKVEFEVEHYDHHSSFIKTPNRFIRPFDLSNAPLLRVGLVKLGEEKYLLMIDMHHIISDGTSMKVFINDFMALYARPGEALSPLRLQYKDFSEWQHSKKGREMVKAQEEYWWLRFQGDIPELKLTYDYPVPVERDSRGNRFDFQLTLEETEELKQVAQEEGVTFFMLLLAIYVVLLHKLSWSEDIVVGTPVMARAHAELHPIIGMFVNTLAIRSYPSGQKTFKVFLEEIKKSTLEAFQNHTYPFDDLVERVAKVWKPAHNPLFDTVFTLQNIDIPEIEIPGLKLKPYEYNHPTSKFDLTWIGEEKDDTLCFTVEYRSSLFKEEKIIRFVSYFKEIIAVVLDNRDIQLDHIDISLGLSDSEKTIYEEASGDFGF